MKLGFLGPRGTFSFEACKKYNKEAEYVEFKNITDTILGLKNGMVDEVIVPIENSIQGGVTETIDSLILNGGIYIKKELVLKIAQNLMAMRKYELDEIKEVYSHPQAIAQCKNFIESSLKNAVINQVASTALAAKEVSRKEYCACIANVSCIEEYGLELLQDNIQTNDLNQTKFWVLSKEETNVGNKMSIIFSTSHKPGALYEVLGIFNKNNINLTKIESRPAKTFLGEYIFLVDLEVNDKIDETIEVLKDECRYLKVLGRYE